MKINWNEFDGNSSEMDTIIEFSIGRSIKYVSQNIWSPEAKKELKKLKKLPLEIARRRASKWLARNGIFHKGNRWDHF
jgi:hypothetical protein